MGTASVCVKTKSKKVYKNSYINQDAEDTDNIVYIRDEDLARSPNQINESIKIELLHQQLNVENIRLEHCLRLAAGTRVMLTNNPDPVLGLIAGSIGTVLGFVYYDNQPSNGHANILAYAIGVVAPHCNIAENTAAQDIQLPIVLVQINKNCYKNKTFTLSNFQGDSTPSVVPIAPISLTFKYQNQKIVRTHKFRLCYHLVLLYTSVKL